MNAATNKDEKTFPEGGDHENDSTSDQEILPGAKISDAILFQDRLGSEVKVTPVLVEFRRLIQSGSSTVDVVPGVRLT